jgi:hypothetical protein
MVRKGKLSNDYIDFQSGFAGIATNIDPLALPDGLLPEATNITFSSEGEIHSVKQPLQVGNTLPAAIVGIYMWKKDNSTSVLIAQAGNTLYKLVGTTWTSFKTFTTTERASFASGFFDILYIMHHTDGFFSYNGTTVTQVLEAPKSKYLLLWTAYLFAGGDLSENKQTEPTDTTYAPFRVRWSGIVDNAFNGWYAADEETGIETVNNFIDMRTSDNSNITGLGVWNRRIIVSTQDSIEEIVGSKPSLFQTNTIYKGHLTCVDNTFAYYDYVYYLSPEGLCVMGNEAIVIGDIYKKYWKSSGTYYSLAEYNGGIWGNQDDDIMRYNTLTKTFEHYNITGASYLYSSSDTLYLGDKSGKVWKWEGGTGYLTWNFKTKEMSFNHIQHYKRPVQLTITYEKTSAPSVVTVKGIYDGTIKDIGTFDCHDGEYTNFWISEPLFRRAQFQFSGSGEVNIKTIQFNAKVRSVGYVT